MLRQILELFMTERSMWGDSLIAELSID